MRSPATMKNADREIRIGSVYVDVVAQQIFERTIAARLPLDAEDVNLALCRADGPGSKAIVPHEDFIKCDARIVGRQA